MAKRLPDTRATRSAAPALSIVMALLSLGALQAQSPVTRRPVDQTLTRKVDLTGDGMPETIALRLRGRSWQDPLKWTLSISSKGRVLFTHDSDDAWLDEFFADQGYVNDRCRTYLACKRQYYLNDILDNLVVRPEWPADHHALSDETDGSIRKTLIPQLSGKYRKAPAQADAIARSVKAKVQSGRTLLVYVPISAVQSEYPRIWVGGVGAFLTLYEW